MKKYHYIIISSFDPSDILLDRRNNPHAVPVNWEQAEIEGQAALKVFNADPDQYYVKLVEHIESSEPVANNYKIDKDIITDKIY